MAILLNDDELGALYGLPALPFRVYVQSIRPRMDGATGMVGFAYKISYQAIKEDIYVEPVPGVKHEAVSTDQLFRAVRVLAKAGLIAISSEMAEKRLIFKCLLASLRSYVQNKAATRPRLQAAGLQASNGEDLGGVGRDLENHQAATHLRSKNIEVYKSSSSTRDVSTTGPQGGRVETPLSIAPQGGACDPLESTNTPQEPETDLFGKQTLINAFSEGSGVEFWPSVLNQSQRGAIAVKLQTVEHSKRQVVVDELAGFMGRAGKPVENPVRYVDFIIEKARHQLWFPEQAGRIKAAREAAIQQAKKREQEDAEFKEKINLGVSKQSQMPAALVDKWLKKQKAAA